MTFNIPGFRFAPGEGMIDDSEWESKINKQEPRGDFDPLLDSCGSISGSA